LARNFAVVQQHIEQIKARWVLDYAPTWQHLIAEWKTDAAEDRAWLTYSANYLLRTGSVRWAIDPFSLRARLPAAAPVDVASDLSGLSFVLLTHQHADHLDLDLIRALRSQPIQWIIPAFLQAQVVAPCGLDAGQVITPAPRQAIEIGGVTILPFDGLHWENRSDGIRGVPSMSYLAEFHGKRWLFAGDIRDYNLEHLPALGRLDGVFAHLWLGRGSALCKQPPLLDAFCRFFAGLDAPRLVITHLKELGRDPNDFWDRWHYALARTRLAELNPRLRVRCCQMGQSIRMG